MSGVIVAVTALAVIAILHVAARAWVVRRARQDDARAAGTGERAFRWLGRGLREILPPAAFLIWMHGLWLAARLLLREQEPGTIPAQVQAGLEWAYRIALLLGMFWLLSRVGRLIEAFLISLASRAQTTWDDLLLPLAGKTVRLALPLVAFILGAPALSASPALAEIVGHLTSLLLIGVVAFMLAQAVNAAAEFVLARHRIDVTDNLQARAVYTQVIVLKKVALTIVGVFTLASMLMVFDAVRQFGASILASAGIAGIVVGFAAQRSIATLLAGFQIALTQPIRVDDVVIVENEWGRIEDITLTYVVVRVWDQRRLIVPITYFIEQPFQNWTRSSAEILATVFVHVDYTAPVDALREELTRVLHASPHWDGRVNVLQVTAAKEHTLELRALASAADASKAWDLRCEVREQLVAFLQRTRPESLPRLRATLASPPAAAQPADRAAPATVAANHPNA
jgi:small-conductance mechanosensitive channel